MVENEKTKTFSEKEDFWEFWGRKKLWYLILPRNFLPRWKIPVDVQINLTIMSERLRGNKLALNLETVQITFLTTAYSPILSWTKRYSETFLLESRYAFWLSSELCHIDHVNSKLRRQSGILSKLTPYVHMPAPPFLPERYFPDYSIRYSEIRLLQ